jgi:ABC-type multidrug transport system ATPase subunit
MRNKSFDTDSGRESDFTAAYSRKVRIRALNITFRNVCLTLPAKGRNYDAKRILVNVTGHIGPGMCALMGPSASGIFA